MVEENHNERKENNDSNNHHNNHSNHHNNHNNHSNHQNHNNHNKNHNHQNHHEKKEEHHEKKEEHHNNHSNNHSNHHNNNHSNHPTNNDNSNNNNSNENPIAKKISKELTGNYWAISTIVLAVILTFMAFNPIATGGVIGEKEAGSIVLNLLEETGGVGAELVSVNFKDDMDMYEVIFSVQGQEQPIYLSANGKTLMPSAFAVEDILSQEQAPQTQQQAPASTGYTEEDLANIKEFSTCLADEGIKVYGAGWCGYCKQLKETFGGEDSISPIYTECQNPDRTPTENADICQQEDVKGFPTVKLNGELYQGSRTLEAFAQATGCDAPELEGTQ